jgi:GntR family transcriptional regulator, rspAB operon transcriptional repressor
MVSSPLLTQLADTGSASDRAYGLIRQAILDLTFLPGSALSESVLVDQIGVSRTPVRQALQRLEHEGLVRVFPQRGTVVAPLDLQGFREALFTRVSLEASAASAAAVRATSEDCADLREHVAQQFQAVSSGRDSEFFRLNDLFHSRIMLMAGVPNVWAVVKSVKVHLDRFRAAHLMLTDPYPLGPVVEEHAALVDAFARSMATDAATTMQDHIRKVIPRAELLHERRPELFAWPAGLVSPTRLRSIPTN